MQNKRFIFQSPSPSDFKCTKQQENSQNFQNMEQKGEHAGAHQLLPWTPRIFAVLRVTSRLSKFLIPTLTFHTRRTFATFDSHLSSSLVTCDNVMDERTKITFNIQIQPSLKAELAFFFPHVLRAQRLAPASTRIRVVRLGAQCTDHQTTGQSCGVGVPAVQLTTRVKSSILYGRSYGRTQMGYYYFV